jgi:hypothetical protein
MKKRFKGGFLTETLNEAGLRLIDRPWSGAVVLEDENGKLELWQANQHHAGYTVKVGRWSYEFIRSVPVFGRD